jgi:hypothetical protein
MYLLMHSGRPWSRPPAVITRRRFEVEFEMVWAIQRAHRLSVLR